MENLTPVQKYVLSLLNKKSYYQNTDSILTWDSGSDGEDYECFTMVRNNNSIVAMTLTRGAGGQYTVEETTDLVNKAFGVDSGECYFPWSDESTFDVEFQTISLDEQSPRFEFPQWLDDLNTEDNEETDDILEVLSWSK